MPTPFTIGVHCSHEQWSPDILLRHVKQADAVGFADAMCSDHFFPWTEHQGQSGHTWAWLGSALEATGLSFGTVCAPGQRYHPAVIAQAAATLSVMYGGRFWLALGSGEALNEHITGDAWPPKRERQARVEECVEVMRRLWAGEMVTHRGRVRVNDAMLYSRPAIPPLVVGAAVSEVSAAWVGTWADALITVARDRETLSRIVDAFRRGGGAGKPMFLQAVVAFAPERQGHGIVWREWPQCVLDPETLADVTLPREFEQRLQSFTAEAAGGCARVSDSIARHVEWLEGDRQLGFERVYLHDISRDTPYFAETWGRRLLQQLTP